MKPLLPPVVMALVRCPIVDYFTIVPICRYPEQLSGRATPTLPSWIPPAYLLYTVSLSYALEPARMLRTIFVIDTLLSPTFVFFFSPLYTYIFLFFILLKKKKEEWAERFNDEYNVNIRCWNYFSFENVTNLEKIFHYKIALQSSIDCEYLCKFTLFWTQTEKIESSQKLVSVNKCYNEYYTYIGYLIYFCILLS